MSNRSSPSRSWPPSSAAALYLSADRSGDTNNNNNNNVDSNVQVARDKHSGTIVGLSTMSHNNNSNDPPSLSCVLRTPYVYVEEDTNHHHNSSAQWYASLAARIRTELHGGGEVLTATVGPSGSGKTSLLFGSVLDGLENRSYCSLFDHVVGGILSHEEDSDKTIAFSVMEVIETPSFHNNNNTSEIIVTDLISGVQKRSGDNNNYNHYFMEDDADLPALSYVSCSSLAECRQCLSAALAHSYSWTNLHTNNSKKKGEVLRPSLVLDQPLKGHILLTLLTTIEETPCVWKVVDLVGPMANTTKKGFQYFSNKTHDELRSALSELYTNNTIMNKSSNPIIRVITRSLETSSTAAMVIACLSQSSEYNILNEETLQLAAMWNHHQNNNNDNNNNPKRFERLKDNLEAAGMILQQYAIKATLFLKRSSKLRKLKHKKVLQEDKENNNNNTPRAETPPKPISNNNNNENRKAAYSPPSLVHTSLPQRYHTLEHNNNNHHRHRTSGVELLGDFTAASHTNNNNNEKMNSSLLKNIANEIREWKLKEMQSLNVLSTVISESATELKNITLHQSENNNSDNKDFIQWHSDQEKILFLEEELIKTRRQFSNNNNNSDGTQYIDLILASPLYQEMESYCARVEEENEKLKELVKTLKDNNNNNNNNSFSSMPNVTPIESRSLHTIHPNDNNNTNNNSKSISLEEVRAVTGWEKLLENDVAPNNNNNDGALILDEGARLAQILSRATKQEDNNNNNNENNCCFDIMIHPPTQDSEYRKEYSLSAAERVSYAVEEVQECALRLLSNNYNVTRSEDDTNTSYTYSKEVLREERQLYDAVSDARNTSREAAESLREAARREKDYLAALVFEGV